MLGREKDWEGRGWGRCINSQRSWWQGGIITKRRKTCDRILCVTLTKISEHLNKVDGFFKVKRNLTQKRRTLKLNSYLGRNWKNNKGLDPHRFIGEFYQIFKEKANPTYLTFFQDIGKKEVTTWLIPQVPWSGPGQGHNKVG